jgi:hypothetical protein
MEEDTTVRSLKRPAERALKAKDGLRGSKHLTISSV